MTASLNSTSAALLGLLHERAMTGGELLAAAQERLGSFWTLTRSQVYRELPALASAGFVKMGQAGPRSAQPYSVTTAGKRAFTSWLSEPAGPDHSRNPVLLRLGFGPQHNKKQLTALLTDARAEHQAALAMHRETQTRLRRDNGERFAVATAEFGVAYEKAVLKWLDTVPTG
ncbi:helix-turn-helix transcriptional regulator [soil metagenome]